MPFVKVFRYVTSQLHTWFGAVAICSSGLCLFLGLVSVLCDSNLASFRTLGVDSTFFSMPLVLVFEIAFTTSSNAFGALAFFASFYRKNRILRCFQVLPTPSARSPLVGEGDFVSPMRPVMTYGG